MRLKKAAKIFHTNPRDISSFRKRIGNARHEMQWFGFPIIQTTVVGAALSYYANWFWYLRARKSEARNRN